MSSKRIPARVMAVVSEREKGSFIVLLEEIEGERVVPIWVGGFEGTNIGMALRGIRSIRPLPYDLFLDFLRQINATIQNVTICDLRDNTYYAEIRIEQDGREIVLDSRPSDALALALRMNAPIYIEEHVLESAGVPKFQVRLEMEEATEEEEAEEKKQFQSWLEMLRPEFFTGQEESESDEPEEPEEPREE